MSYNPLENSHLKFTVNLAVPLQIIKTNMLEPLTDIILFRSSIHVATASYSNALQRKATRYINLGFRSSTARRFEIEASVYKKDFTFMLSEKLVTSDQEEALEKLKEWCINITNCVKTGASYVNKESGRKNQA